MVAAQVIKSMNQQDDDDSYEAKSVRDLKAMFNKPSKPPVPGQSKAYSVTHLSSSVTVRAIHAVNSLFRHSNFSGH